jgi:prevent-host-death family protein
MRLRDFDPPPELPTISVGELRTALSEIVSAAAYSADPIVITRRGTKIAALISLEDLIFLVRMKAREEEILNEEVPEDSEGIGRAQARRLQCQLFFG